MVVTPCCVGRSANGGAIRASGKHACHDLAMEHSHKLRDRIACSPGVGASGEQSETLRLSVLPVHLRCLQHAPVRLAMWCGVVNWIMMSQCTDATASLKCLLLLTS